MVACAELKPLSAGLCADDTGVSVTPVNWSVLSSADPVCAAETSSLLPGRLLSADGHKKVQAVKCSCWHCFNVFISVSERNTNNGSKSKNYSCGCSSLHFSL